MKMSSAEDLSRLDAIEKALLNRWPESRNAPTLERISTLADYLGSPQLSYPTIHIAGTNGKTTTTRIIDSLCFELGMRTGRFTSPHLESFLERITINGQSITPEFLIATYNDIAPYLELVDSKMPNRLSFFESMCALAFVAFAEFPVDVGIFECGIGGEWDSTNVINGAVNVITPISFDHMQYLGESLEEIAQTKSGIIKDNSFVVLAEQESEVAAVLMRACAKADATPIRSGIEFSLKSRALALGGQMLTISGVYGQYEDLYLPLYGQHQAGNAATALAAVEVFAGESKLDEEVVRQAFAKASSPGRCEIVRRNPTIIIDAAHNPHGAESLRKTIVEEFDFSALIGVFAPMGDKDVAGILEALETVLDRVIVTRNSSHRAADVDELKSLAMEIFGSDRVYASDDLEQGITQAIDMARTSNALNDSNAAVLIAGSVISAGEARAIVRRKGI
jgi:dihydrofolate synthase/folylpolyglutamate synthase